jgi:hypothetical protein
MNTLDALKQKLDLLKAFLSNPSEELLEKARKIIVEKKHESKASVKQPETRAEGDPGISFKTVESKTRFKSNGNKENPNDKATYSEHILIHHGKPSALLGVHHTDDGQHDVKILDGKVEPKMEASVRAKVRAHTKSSEFSKHVNDHNKKHYDYDKPKIGWMFANKKDKKKT